MTTTQREILCQIGRLEVFQFLSAEDVVSISSWFSTDEDDLFFTSATLDFPCHADQFLAYYKANHKIGSHEFFSIFDRETNQHIGHFEFKAISAKLGAGTLAHFYLSKPWRKKGLSKSLVQLVAQVAFEKLGLYRVGLAVHSTNGSAVAAYVKGGFVFEGIVRDVIPRGDKRYSLYQMSLLRPEWQLNLKGNKRA